MKISYKVKKARLSVVNINDRITQLEDKRENKLIDLQEICQHEYISEYLSDGNFWKGRRICEICSFEEKYGGSGYKILETDRVRKIDLTQLCDIRRMEY